MNAHFPKKIRFAMDARTTMDTIYLPDLSKLTTLATYTLIGLIRSIFINACRQLFFRLKTEPPTVFHWKPYIGNVVSYGMDPVGFFEKHREKYGDIFTFTLFGRRLICYLGLTGNEFILNGKLSDVNAEEIYGPLTTPVFGEDIIYDCPNAKLMEQKKFVKFGLTQAALESHVPLIEGEVLQYVEAWKGESGTVDVCAAMAEITLFTAARSLQGKEVRQKLTREFAGLYHDLDMGFSPINFLFPWLPLPRNRRRDAAHVKMRAVYEELIQRRRKDGLDSNNTAEHDMIWNLMNSCYKNGTPLPDKEIACMMITLLMGGQHSSSSASAWIILRLAAHPDIAEELYQEQVTNLRSNDNSTFSPLRYSDLENLPLLHNVVKETLRLHGSIDSILRKVKNPLPIPGTPYVVGTDKVLLAPPMVTAVSEVFFANAKAWDPHRWDTTSTTNTSTTNTSTTNTSTTNTSTTNTSTTSNTTNATDRKEKPSEPEEETIDPGYGLVTKGTKSPYLPFGAGRHRCIGEKFAYLNLGVIIATIVRNLRLETIDGKTGEVPRTDHTSMFARPVQPAVVRWVTRN